MSQKSDWDVIVVGGGVAGLISATASARNGAETLLIERDASLGGTMTTSLVGPMMTFHSSEEQVIRGLAQELVDRLMVLGFSPGHIPDSTGYVKTITPFDSEGLKLVAQRMVLESNAQILFHALVTDVAVEKKRIKAVVINHKGGDEELNAKIIIDASGDADVAYKAGAPCDIGRTSDGLVQPTSLIFKLGNVDIESLKDYLIRNPKEAQARLGPRGIDAYAEEPLVAVCAFEDKLQDAIRAGEVPLKREHVLLFSTNRPSEVTVNMSRIAGINPLDAWDLTRAELKGREQIHAIFKFLRENVPGLANAVLISSGSRVGIRESRRIQGEYVLTIEDIISSRDFSDAIACSAYPVDIHAVKPEEPHRDVFVPKGEVYGIPYRCLIPQAIDNLLVAGRCISTTHEAHGSTRVSPTCMAFGQAAGTAAALSLKQGVIPRKLNPDLLRKTLLQQGAYLGTTD